MPLTQGWHDGVMPDQHRRCARILGVHAFVVGIGWFAIGLPAFLLLASHPPLQAALGSGASAAPFWLLLGLLVVAAIFALPLLWPLHLAVGWYELGLVGRIRRGDHRAHRLARRMLLGHAVGYAVIAAGLAVWWRGNPAFLVPLAVGGVHAALARQFRLDGSTRWPPRLRA